MSPGIRVAVRALLAGILAAGASLQAASDYGTSVVVTACIAGVLAAAVLASAELTTPVNPTVGIGKP